MLGSGRSSLLAGGALVALTILLILSQQPEHASRTRLVRLRPSLMEAALARGDVDAFVAWEPHCTHAVLTGRARVLAPSSAIWPRHPCCVLAARTAFLQENPGVGAALVRVHERATDFVREHPREAAEIFSRATGMDPTATSQAMAGIDYGTELDQGGLVSYIEAIMDLGLVPPDTDPGAAVTRLVAESGSDIALDGNVTVRMGWLAGDLHHAAFLIAREKGMFATEGIVVETVAFENGVRAMDGFAAGDIDAGYLGAAPLVLKSVAAHVPVQVLAAVNREGSCLAVAADGPVNATSDLAGRSIAIPGFGTVQHVLAQRALRDAGIVVEGVA